MADLIVSILMKTQNIYNEQLKKTKNIRKRLIKIKKARKKQIIIKLSKIE